MWTWALDVTSDKNKISMNLTRIYSTIAYPFIFAKKLLVNVINMQTHTLVRQTEMKWDTLLCETLYMSE